MSILASLVALGLAQAAATGGAAPAPSDPPSLFDDLFGPTTEPSDRSSGARAGRDDLSLVTLRAGPHVLNDALPLYKVETGWCGPVDALLDALGVEHHVEKDHLVVTLHEPRRRHSLDTARLEQSPEGACLPIDDAGKLVEAELRYDPVELAVYVTSDVPVPAQASAERADSRARRIVTDEPARPDYPRLANPPRWAAVPTIDVALAAGWDGQRLATSAVSEGASDFAKGTARWRVSASPQAGIRLSAKLERVDPDGEMLGPLHARRIEAGDTSIPSQALVGAAVQGRGLVISNAPEWRADIFDRLVIAGPLAPGWQAELSSAGRLIGFVDKPDAQGEYRFVDIPLKVGANQFVIDLYGPHGEHVRRTYERQVGSAQNPENETSMTFGVLVPARKAGNALEGDSPTAQPAAAFAILATGIDDWVSARFDARRALRGREQAVGLSVDASVLGGIGGLSLAFRKPGGIAGSAIFSRRLGGFNATAQYSDYGPSPGPWAGVDEQGTRSRLSLDLGGSVAIAGTRVALAAGFTRSVDRSGVVRSGLKTQVSFRVGALKFDNQLQQEWGSDRRALGALSLGWSRGRVNLRGQFGYRLWPSAAIEQFSLTADTKVRSWMVRGGAIYNAAEQTGRVNLGVSRRVGAFDVSVDGGWGTDGPVISTGLRFAIGHVPGRGIRPLPTGASRMGLLMPALTDAAGAPVAGARYLVANSLRQEESAADGKAIIDGIAPGKPVDLALQLSSLEDDRLRPDRAGVRVAARPGQILSIPVRLNATGSIEVRLIRRSGDQTTPLSGVSITLEGPTGEKRNAVSDFDGYVVVDGLTYGHYRTSANFAGHSVSETISLDAEHRDVFKEMLF